MMPLGYRPPYLLHYGQYCRLCDALEINQVTSWPHLILHPRCLMTIQMIPCSVVWSPSVVCCSLLGAKGLANLPDCLQKESIGPRTGHQQGTVDWPSSYWSPMPYTLTQWPFWIPWGVSHSPRSPTSAQFRRRSPERTMTVSRAALQV